MGRFRKGGIGKQKKKRLVPVTVHETRMGKQQHTTYVQLLEEVMGSPRLSTDRNPTPPQVRPLSIFRHPRRKEIRINNDLTQAFHAAHNEVFVRPGVSPDGPFLSPTVLKAAKG